MAIRTDRFKVKAIRPVAHLRDEEVPQDLVERLQDQVVTPRDLEEYGADMQTADFYHGGGSQAVVYWHGKEYVLDLEPVA